MIPPEQLEAHAKSCVDALVRQLPRDVGCTVFLFQYGDNQGIGYASSAKRVQMIEVVRNWLRRQTIEVFKS
jgi:hypothetical protein